MNDPAESAEAVGHERVVRDAEARGLPLRVIQRPPAGSLLEAASLMGIEPGDIVKSLVVKRHDGDFVFALIPGGRKISWPKLRGLLGVNKLSLPHAAVALDVTGYERGTITPFGSTTPWPVVADARVTGEITLGAGAHGVAVALDAAAALAALGATVADVSDRDPPAP